MAGLDIEQSLNSLRKAYADLHAMHIVNKMAGLDLKLTLADNDLQKVGGMCDLAGVNVGYPFLHAAMVDFSARLPADQKVHRRNIRYFFKNALSDYLPEQIINKQKHGFGLPFGDWLVSHKGLRNMAFDSLTGLKRRGIVRPDFLDDLIDRRITEHPNYYGGFVWVLMILEQCLERSSTFSRMN